MLLILLDGADLKLNLDKNVRIFTIMRLVFYNS